jgi:AcrR family transcriptional regulator
MPKASPTRPPRAARPPLGLRERKKARMRQQIIDTTAELIRTRGYEETTIEEIVRRCEVSQPTFYNYFSSKDAVLGALAHQVLEAWSTSVEEETKSPASAEDKLRRLYSAQARWMVADKPVWRAIVLSDAMNVYRTPERDVEPHLAVQRYLQTILAEGQRRGEITRDLSAARLVENLIAIQIVACAAWGVDKLGRQSLARTLDENLDFFMRAVAR